MRMTRTVIFPRTIYQFAFRTEISSILKNFVRKDGTTGLPARSSSSDQKSIESTHELTDVILRHSLPLSETKNSPPTRTFPGDQKLLVNRELEALESRSIKRSIFWNRRTDLCGRIPFARDKIVKEKFRKFCKIGRISVLFKKPLIPSQRKSIGIPVPAAPGWESQRRSNEINKIHKIHVPLNGVCLVYIICKCRSLIWRIKEKEREWIA